MKRFALPELITAALRSRANLLVSIQHSAKGSLLPEAFFYDVLTRYAVERIER